MFNEHCFGNLNRIMKRGNGQYVAALLWDREGKHLSTIYKSTDSWSARGKEHYCGEFRSRVWRVLGIQDMK